MSLMTKVVLVLMAVDVEGYIAVREHGFDGASSSSGGPIAEEAWDEVVASLGAMEGEQRNVAIAVDAHGSLSEVGLAGDVEAATVGVQADGNKTEIWTNQAGGYEAGADQAVAFDRILSGKKKTYCRTVQDYNEKAKRKQFLGFIETQMLELAKQCKSCGITQEKAKSGGFSDDPGKFKDKFLNQATADNPDFLKDGTELCLLGFQRDRKKDAVKGVKPFMDPLRPTVFRLLKVVKGAEGGPELHFAAGNVEPGTGEARTDIWKKMKK